MKSQDVPNNLWLKLTIIRNGKSLPIWISTSSIDSMGEGPEGETIINTATRGWRVEESIADVLAIMAKKV